MSFLFYAMKHWYNRRVCSFVDSSIDVKNNLIWLNGVMSKVEGFRTVYLSHFVFKFGSDDNMENSIPY